MFKINQVTIAQVSYLTLFSQAIERLRDAYNGSLDRIDAYPAGLLEATPDSIGPLFTAVILDQFMRIRDADRFWFENLENRRVGLKFEAVSFRRSLYWVTNQTIAALTLVHRFLHKTQIGENLKRVEMKWC